MNADRGSLALTIRPCFSWRLTLYVTLVHALACTVCVALPIGLWRVPLLLVVVASGLYALSVHVFRWAPWSIESVHWGADGSWQVAFVSTPTVTATLATTTFVSPALVILDLRLGPWRRCTLPLFSDALDPALRRRLRQRLRVEAVVHETRSAFG